MKWKEETRGRMFEPGSKEGDRVWMGIHDSILGVLKNAAVPAPEHRQAGQRRSCPLAVLTDSLVRSGSPSVCGFPFECLRTVWTGPFGQRLRACFLNTTFFVWLSVTHMRINRQNISIV